MDIEELGKINNIGTTTLRKLREGGFRSVESLECTPPQIIREESGIGEKTVGKLVRHARNLLGATFESAQKLWERRKDLPYITTGAHELDEILGGGIEVGTLTEFFGEYRTGKTQLMHQLCVTTQLPKGLGGLEGGVIFIDTEGTFRPERVISIAKRYELDEEEVLDNIVYGRAYNSDHQMILIKEVGDIIEKKNIHLVIVDSLIGHFRSEYVGRGTLAKRQQQMNKHMKDLQRLSIIYENLAVIYTNQVSSKPDTFYGNPLRATGGNIMGHGSSIRVYLRKGKGQQRVAKIKQAPTIGEREAIFEIRDEGICDVE